MASFGIQGERDKSGADFGPLFSSKVPKEVWIKARTAFLRSLDHARGFVGGTPDETTKAFDPVGGARWSIASALPEGAWIPSKTLCIMRRSDREMASRLLANDEALLVDSDGYVIVRAASAEERSPVRSSVLELIRTYVSMRHAAKLLGVDLPHQRFCTIVKRQLFREPDQALLELGAIGSFLEQPRPPSKLPAFAYIERNNNPYAERFAAALPPLYTDVIGVTVGLITS